jgi:isopenicillin-N epimerase
MASAFLDRWLLDPEVTFLNHGSFGACPRALIAKQNEFREQMEREPVSFLWRKLDEPLDAARNAVARLINSDPRDVVFVTNATSAVNAVLRSHEFAVGDELLTTDHLYNACGNVLTEVARRAGGRVVVAPVPFPIDRAEQVIEAVLASVTSRTRLALLDHVTSPTALIFPITELVRELERRDIPTLVDGAHAPGMLPIDVAAIGASYYTGNLHKWLCAPRGTGFLHIRSDRQDGIHPAVISHGYNTHRPGRTAFHERFDWQGTGDVTGWLCAGHAIQWCSSLFPGGLSELMQRNRDLTLAARRLLCERLSIEPPCPESMLGSMATLPLPAPFASRPGGIRSDPDQAALFHKHRIEVPFLTWGNPPRRWFRISAQAYNSLDDYERLAQALLA